MNEHTGKIKWFIESSGFGFVEQENGPDLYFHFSAIQENTIAIGTPVKFSITMGHKGQQAHDIIPIQSSPVT